KFCSECGKKKPEVAPKAEWTCKCGAKNTGKFCSECGASKPAEAASWFCPKCGTKNTANFCFECGTKKP
ncbi:MAG: SPFH domain-containing protein, partial [Clostridia bacterium]|nr:SPFH domain-containing protein [Clostridia bacterium]